MSTSVKRLGVLLPALAERPMTVLEIAQLLGVSDINSVHAWVKKVHDAGLIYIDHYGPPAGRTKQRARTCTAPTSSAGLTRLGRRRAMRSEFTSMLQRL